MKDCVNYICICALLIIILLSIIIIVKNLRKITDGSEKMTKLDMINTQYTPPNEHKNFYEIYVWTYWEGIQNDFVDICIDRIKKSCELGSDEKYYFNHIHLTSPQQIKKYIDIDDNICDSSSPAHLKSDIIRLSLLEKYGGIWLDATSFILAPMNKIFHSKGNMQYNLLQAYYNPRNSTLGVNYPVVETSVMYAPKGHPLISAWLKEMNNISTCSEDDRKKYALTSKLGKHMTHLNNVYHFVYYAFMNVLNNNGGIYNFNNVKLYNALDSQFFCFLSFNMNDLFNLTPKEFVKKYKLRYCKLIKFINFERKYISEHLNKASPTCFLKSAPVDISDITIPKFEMKDMRGKKISNENHEYDEQKLIHKNIVEGDNVLQLGGNIGASCLLADKSVRLNTNYCVEPSDNVIPTLLNNTKNTNVKVIHGIISENCGNKYLSTEESDISAFITNNNTDNSNSKKQNINCISLSDIEPKDGFNVIFADCEGCFEDFVKEYENKLTEYPLDTIIYERDNTHQVDYRTVDSFMAKNNFTCKGDFWKVCTK